MVNYGDDFIPVKKGCCLDVVVTQSREHTGKEGSVVAVNEVGTISKDSRVKILLPGNEVISSRIGFIRPVQQDVNVISILHEGIN